MLIKVTVGLVGRKYLKAVFGGVEWDSTNWDSTDWESTNWDASMNHWLNHHAPLLLLHSSSFFNELVLGLPDLLLKAIIYSSLVATAAPAN